MEFEKCRTIGVLVMGVLCALIHNAKAYPTRKNDCAEQLHKAFTAWASNDAKTMTEEYYKLYDNDREKLIDNKYYLANSWMHFDGKDMQGKDNINKFILNRPRLTIHTFRKITGIAIGANAMSILIMGDVIDESQQMRRFAQHWYVSRGKIIVDLFNYFEDKDGNKPQTIIDPYNNIQY